MQDSNLHKELARWNKRLGQLNDTIKEFGEEYNRDVACEIRPQKQHCKYMIKRFLKEFKKSGGDLTEFLFCDMIFVRETAKRMLDETNSSKRS